MRRCRFASSRAICIPTTIRSPRIARPFLPELKDLFVQVLLLAKAGWCAKTWHDQSGRDPRCMPMPATRKAVSYKRLLELETQLQVEVEELFA